MSASDQGAVIRICPYCGHVMALVIPSPSSAKVGDVTAGDFIICVDCASTAIVGRDFRLRRLDHLETYLASLDMRLQNDVRDVRQHLASKSMAAPFVESN